jgi:hypothetical protein
MDGFPAQEMTRKSARLVLNRLVLNVKLSALGMLWPDAVPTLLPGSGWDGCSLPAIAGSTRSTFTLLEPIVTC